MAGSKDKGYNSNNPCIREQQQSAKCLDDNNYDRDSCYAYFENYKRCKEFWDGVVKHRRIKNIKPYLPEPEERKVIKEEYLRNLRK